MFFEVKVHYPKNNKKKIISSKELSHNHWVNFEERKKRFSKKILNKDLAVVRKQQVVITI